MSNPEHIAPVIKRTMKRFRLTPPKPFIPKEYDEQCAVFDYARVKARQDRRWHLLFSTLNGVRLPIGLAKKCKRAGNKPGVPDLILPVRGYAACPGLYIELKRIKGGRVDEEQNFFHHLLRQQGYQVEVCRGATEAINVINAYLDKTR